tara:strand:+ start:27121 stop:27795 length:675 start_codon:yes stop_codon:yes gene_type:complete
MYKIFITIKENSQRVKKKNFIRFKNNTPLFKVLIYKLNKFKIYIDTDSKKIMKSVNNDKLIKNTTVYLREKKFIKMENDGKSPGPYMIENFLKKFVQDQNEPIIHAHVTSPFLRQKTLMDAIQFMSKGYDSVTSCNKIRKIAFLKDKKFKPINFKFENQHVRTQNLNPIYVLNSAFFIFRKKFFMKKLNRISKNNYFYQLKFPEYIDIDEKEDVIISRLSKKYL